jgi:NAD(P)H-flavin reductase
MIRPIPRIRYLASHCPIGPSSASRSFTAPWLSSYQLSNLRASPTPRNSQQARPFSTTRKIQQTTNDSPEGTGSTSERPRRSTIPRLLSLVLLSGAVAYTTILLPSPKETLSPTSFTRFTILSRETVSPNSYILTLSPEKPSSSPDLPYSTPSSPWNTRLWAVEIRQPQLQIVRHYTPLPPRPDVPEDRKTLRLLIRTVPRGEVSNYLAKMPIGEAVDVRLEESFYDFADEDSMRNATPESTETSISAKKSSPMDKKSQTRDVVLLAGGTGVATALQAIHALHSAHPSEENLPKITVFWSVRSRDDIQTSPTPNQTSSPTSWFFWTQKAKSSQQLTATLENPTEITRHLQSLQSSPLSSPLHENFKIYTTVDDEQTSVSYSTLKSAIKAHTPEITPHPKVTSEPLYTGSLGPQSWHLFRTRALQASSSPAQRILIASGPDGFVEKYAGHVLLHRVNSASGSLSFVFRRHGGTFVKLLKEDGDMAASWSIVDVPPRPAQVAFGGV